MIAVTDGVGRGSGSGSAEWQGSSIVPDQCESVSIAIETGATLGRHAFISFIITAGNKGSNKSP